MKICDKPVDHDGVDKVMQKNKKMTDFDNSSLQSDKLMHEESNDAVISNGETIYNTDTTIKQTNQNENRMPLIPMKQRCAMMKRWISTLIFAETALWMTMNRLMQKE